MIAPAPDAGPGVVLDPGTFDLLNLGDLAMLQVALSRVRARRPGAPVHVFTRDAAALARHCPGTLPLDEDVRLAWFAERYFLGRVHETLPVPVSRGLVAAQRAARRRWPRLTEGAMRMRAGVRGVGRAAADGLLRATNDASLVAMAGQHGLADTFRARARVMLDTLDAAIRRGIPTAMFSQAFGPLTDPALVAQARDVLPRVGFIALREGMMSLPLAIGLGVDPARVVVTGDDALALAHGWADRATREAVGVSVRTTPVAGVQLEVVDRLRDPLRDFAREHGVPLIPLPSAHHAVARDARTLRLLLGESDGGAAVDSTEALAAETGRCRVVLAGAYHVAVFALAMGIPVVALARSAYYHQKFEGLGEQFGGGCEIIPTDHPSLGIAVRDALDRAWDAAPAQREALLAAAARQVRAIDAAYDRVLGAAAARGIA